jgi:hypothetical protein
VPNELVPRNVLRNLRRRWAPSVNHTCAKDFRIDFKRWKFLPLVISYIEHLRRRLRCRYCP